MAEDRTGQIAVIFISERTRDDDAGYAAAAEAMAALAAEQPGYRGVDAVRGADRIGVTVSYWADEASAVAWRHNEDHVRIREAGRRRWYHWYRLHVATIGRSHAWERM